MLRYVNFDVKLLFDMSSCDSLQLWMKNNEQINKKIQTTVVFGYKYTDPCLFQGNLVFHYLFTPSVYP
jgi:hypothetical protein